MSDKRIKVGLTEVIVKIYGWNKHNRDNYMISILCANDQFSDYDGLRRKPSFDDLREVLDFLIEEENQTELINYTQKQLEELRNHIIERLNA
jgi:hypothetical protein